MRILMIIATGAIFTFPMQKGVEPDCFTQGHAILEKLATYQGPGPEQGWYLKGTRVQVGGWYCR